MIENNKITIPDNTLWQYLEKEHLIEEDSSFTLTDDEWKEFCRLYNDTFANYCSEIGRDLLADYLKQREK